MAQAQAPTSGVTPESQAADKMHLRALLRRARRARRDSATPSDREAAGRQAVLSLLQNPAVQAANCVALYEALPTEEDVSLLTEFATNATRFIAPITLADKDLSWRDLGTDEDLGPQGIALADAIIVPALAVGPAGQRLGQGGGSYDRALPRRRPGTPVIAVVFPDEVGLDIPCEPHDEAVDAVATREGLTLFGPRPDKRASPGSSA